jgi:diphthine synthase
MIGIGLNDEKDITLKGLEAVKKCGSVYLEGYTSRLQCRVEDLEKLYGKKIIVAGRDMVEKKAEETILKDARENDAAFLVIGDAFGATTHTDLRMRALDAGIRVHIINNASILNAVGVTGLELYKFGKTTSIPFDNGNVKTPFEVLKENQKMGLHTLFLLDLNPKENRYMTANNAIEYLLKQGLPDESICIGCARIGSDSPMIKSGKAKDLLDSDFGDAPHCLIVPGKLHFMEEEALSKSGQP